MVKSNGGRKSLSDICNFPSVLLQRLIFMTSYPHLQIRLSSDCMVSQSENTLVDLPGTYKRS